MDELTFCFVMDGACWSVHIQGFDCLAEHAFGFGYTKKEAVESLVSQLGSDL